MEADDVGRAGAVLRFSFDGAENVEPVPEQALVGTHHFFLGADPTDWRRDVPWFSAIRYPNVAPGVDVVLRTDGSRFEYDVIVQPGGRVEDVVIRCEGADRISRLPSGDLSIRVGPWEMIQPCPQTYVSGVNGRRSAGSAKFEIRGDLTFGFSAPNVPHDSVLVVDPGMVWTTYFGAKQPWLGSNGTTVIINNIRSNDSGETTITGVTGALDLPTTPGAYREEHLGGPQDIYVSRFSSDGALLFSTYIGSTNHYEDALGIDVLPDGSTVVVGRTNGKSDYPVTPGALSINQSPSNFSDIVIVTRIDNTGGALVFSAVFGGLQKNDGGTGVAWVEGKGITIHGFTASADYPVTTGSYQPVYGGGLVDTFITRIDDDGTAILASSYFGGSNDEVITNHRLLVDPDGSTVVCAEVQGGTNLPTTPGAFMTSSTASVAAYVAKLDGDLSTLDFCTFLNSTQSVRMYGVARHPQGWITVFGGGKGFPATPGTVTGSAQGTSLLVGNLSADGSTLHHGLTIGTPSLDEAGQMAIDGAGNIIISGKISSALYPTTPGAHDETFNNTNGDAVITKLNPSLSDVLYSTYYGGVVSSIGGQANTGAPRIFLDVDGKGDVSIAGLTDAIDLPTAPGVFARDFPGLVSSGFVAKFDLLPKGAARVGEPTPGCDGPPGIWVSKAPQTGATDFRIGAFHGPKSSTGLLGVSTGVLPRPLNASGAAFWLDPSFLLLVPVPTDNLGIGEVNIALGLTVTPPGAEFALQYFWPDQCAGGGVSSSAALKIRVLP